VRERKEREATLFRPLEGRKALKGEPQECGRLKKAFGDENG
jgi:hypothetical protein